MGRQGNAVLMELSTEVIHPKRVCIIGAGAAGLVAIRHVSASPALFGTVFEMADSIGGIWVYSDETGKDRTPMYKNMRTNLPKEIMRFLDLPFGCTQNDDRAHPPPSFVSHFEVVEYFKAYADKFQLWNHIKFNSKVIEVKPIITEDNRTGKPNPLTWEVIVEHTFSTKPPPENTGETNGSCSEFGKYNFDSVIVCSGNFSYPLIPDSYNIAEFQGKVLHSRDYRIADDFINQTVLLVGRGPSGVDIALEIAQVATEVIISSRKTDPHKSSFPANVRQLPQIKSVRRNGFVFENDEKVECDVVIWCTGYQCHFPFLSSECEVTIENGKAVSPLYRHMIHANFPSLCFIGIIFQTNPFMFFDCQVRYYVKYLEGFVKLPSQFQMNVNIKEARNMKIRRGYSIEVAHQLGDQQWEYFRTLASEAGFNFPGLSVVQKIYEKTAERRANFTSFFKNDSVRIIDDESFEYTESGAHSFS